MRKHTNRPRIKGTPPPGVRAAAKAKLVRESVRNRSGYLYWNVKRSDSCDGCGASAQRERRADGTKVTYCGVNFTSTISWVSRVAGSHFHRRTASSAAWVSTGDPPLISTDLTVPSWATRASTLTTPSRAILRASAG